MTHPTDDYNRAQYIADLEEDCANYSKSMVEADKRANSAEREVQSLRAQVAAQHDAMRTEWKDLLARAEKAEAERDALRERVARLVGAMIPLERAAQRLMDALNAQFDAENPDEAREAGREPPSLDDAIGERGGAWISIGRAIYCSAKARAALEAK